MIKVGIVGARGLSAVSGFKDSPDAQITAICDLNLELLDQMAKKHNIPNQYRVYEDMLDSDIDAVWIATPMNFHVPQAIAALEAGKHVMSEVTAGVTMDELWWLIETVEKYNKIYMFAENCCYYPEIQLVRELVLQGKFGRLYYGEGDYTHYCAHLARYTDGKTSWRKYWQFGKHGTFYPTHGIGPVMLFFPDERIVSIASFGSGYHVHPEFRTEDTSITMCQLSGGQLIKARVDCLSPRPNESTTYFQIQGTDGVYESARGCGDASKIWLRESGEPVEEAAWHKLSEFESILPDRFKNLTEEQIASGHNGSDYLIVQDFINAIKTDTQPELNVYKACEWTAVGLLSELSVTNNGRVMDMPNFRRNMPRSEQFIKL